MIRFLTTPQIAKRFGVAAVTARKWCKRGLFPNVVRGAKTGNGSVYLVPESDLDGFTPPRTGRPPSEKPSAAALAKRQARSRAT